MITKRSLVRVGALLISCAALPACYAEAEPVVLTSAEVEEYPPAYYDGYVVYYDSIGRPFYYEGSSVVWISPGSPYYPGLVHHWEVYGPRYHTWYAHGGYRYRSYRVGPGYHYHGNPGYHGSHRR